MTAFGDGGNDLEMVKEVGDGVAMSNAAPILLKVANHTTTSNNEQGVLTYTFSNTYRQILQLYILNILS